MVYYIQKHALGIKVVDDKQTIIKACSMKTYLNKQCLNYLTTFEGRMHAIKRCLNQKRNIPIFIHANLCLIQTSHLHDPNNLLINICGVLSLKGNDKNTTFVFDEHTVLKIPISKAKIKKKIIAASSLAAMVSFFMKTFF